MVNRLVEVLNTSIDKRDWLPETRLLGEVDSLALVGLITEIEKTYGFTPQLEDLDPEDFETVSSLLQYIERNV